MTDDVHPTSDTAQSTPAVLVALSHEHRVLADANASAPIDEEQLRRFIDKAQRAGALLESPKDRAAASRIMRYWAGEAIRRGTINPSENPPMLAPYGAGPKAGAPVEAATHASDKPLLQSPEEAERIARSRKLIRLAALAREWRVSGGKKGYLLNGTALVEARPFVADDDDIAALVAASEREKTWRRWKYAAAACVLVGVSASAIALWISADKAKLAADEARQEADREVATAKERMSALNSTVNRLSQRSAELQARPGMPYRGVDNGPGTSIDQLPSAAPLVSLPPTDGYHSDFLKVPVPLPIPGPELRSVAFNDGLPVNSINYSVVLNTDRRVALFTASNCDQDTNVLISPQPIVPHRDTTLPPGIQPNPDWSTAEGIAPARLVTGSEIAWGDWMLEGNPEQASQLVYGAVDLYPNIVPQFRSFNQGIWNRLEKYAVSQFNPGIDRISIFSGPILANDDPVIDGVKLPRAYWKILVSTTLNAQSDLQVEAFFVPQMDEQSGEKVPLDKPFDKPGDRDSYRVSVRDIERLTGLDFGERVRDAGQVMISNIGRLEHKPSAGQVLLAEVRALDHLDPVMRQTEAERIIGTLQDRFKVETDQRPVMQSMRALARQDSFKNLTPKARSDLLQALSAVPKNVWDRHDDKDNFGDLKAGARRAVADIESNAPDTMKPIGDLEPLKQRLDWALAGGETVNLQFSGMTRAAAEDIKKNLESLGWTLPGIERTRNAAGVNEVRFAPSDVAAGLLLVEDLKALGRYAVKSTPTTDVVAGKMEVWISD